MVLNTYGSASISLSTLDIPELEANSIYVALQTVFPQGGHFEMYLEVRAYNLQKEGFMSIFKTESPQAQTTPLVRS